jgi:hypothetical protein
MPMLQEAAELLVVLDQNYEDMVDYGNQLRRGMFESYSGTLQGIKGAKAQLMIPYAGHLLHFIYKDSSRCTSKKFGSLICYISDWSCSLTSCACVLLPGMRV